MFAKKILAWYKLGIAGLVIVAVVAQFIEASTRPTFNPVNFFSFFTIESNILAALIFVGIGIAYLMGRDGKRLVLLRGAATLYMTVTGIVYALLLSGSEEALSTTIPWVNFVLHYLFPFVAFADWFIDRPAVRVTLKQSLWWLIFPIAYLAYSLTRGALTGWYPYPFLNPANGGYGQVAFVASLIALVTLVACALFAKLSSSTAPKKRSKK
ncbi:MAG TPA: Pr6Pr family membrane protein [Magnetospirillaceae bacterium]|nr:Pr6Pr family membrane protein [Magnetospirillaceae bacterium]